MTRLNITGPKSPLESRTIVAALVGLLFALLDATGVSLPVGEAETVDAVVKGVEIVAFLVAIWGRVRATERIG